MSASANDRVLPIRLWRGYCIRSLHVAPPTTQPETHRCVYLFVCFSFFFARSNIHGLFVADCVSELKFSMLLTLSLLMLHPPDIHSPIMEN